MYRKYWEEHVQHVDRVLQLLKEHQPYAKHSKCFFMVKVVEYLCHIVCHESDKVVPNKIKAMMDWLIPKMLNTLKVLLGFIGYYCKFFYKYGRLEAPLTTLLKKDAFSWTPKETHSFEKLKVEI